MNYPLILALAVTLGACTTPQSAFVGSPHGYTGSVDTIWADVRGAPSILQEGEAALQSSYGASGEMADMPSTYSRDAAGNVSGTGVAGYILALAEYCRVAPQAALCRGPTE